MCLQCQSPHISVHPPSLPSKCHHQFRMLCCVWNYREYWVNLLGRFIFKGRGGMDQEVVCVYFVCSFNLTSVHLKVVVLLLAFQIISGHVWARFPSYPGIPTSCCKRGHLKVIFDMNAIGILLCYEMCMCMYECVCVCVRVSDWVCK